MMADVQGQDQDIKVADCQVMGIPGDNPILLQFIVEEFQGAVCVQTSVSCTVNFQHT